MSYISSSIIDPAFAASQFVYKRYGPKMGIPLTVLSIFTGVSRIYAHKHDIIAVIGGAAIALFAAEILLRVLRIPLVIFF